MALFKEDVLCKEFSVVDYLCLPCFRIREIDKTCELNKAIDDFMDQTPRIK